jgi:hypothetical protein
MNEIDCVTGLGVPLSLLTIFHTRFGVSVLLVPKRVIFFSFLLIRSFFIDNLNVDLNRNLANLNQGPQGGDP